MSRLPRFDCRYTDNSRDSQFCCQMKADNQQQREVSSVLVCELSQFIYCCMSSINAQELIKHFKDRRDQVKPNPLAKLSLSDQQQQCRAERKVVSCCLSIIDAASCSAILLLVDTVCSQAIQAGL